MGHSAIRICLSCIAVAALAACVAQPVPPPPAPAPPLPAVAPPPPPPPPPPPGAAAIPPGPIPDAQFAQEAAIGGESEVALGRLAEHKGVAPGVRAFAARMVRDHGRANARLMALTRRLHLPPAPPPPPPPGDLAGPAGPALDRQYMADQIAAHRQTIALFEAEAARGANPLLRRFARDSLPMLHSHLREAEAVAGRIGG